VWLPDLAVCIMGGCYCIPSPKGEGFTDPKKGTLKTAEIEAPNLVLGSLAPDMARPAES